MKFLSEGKIVRTLLRRVKNWIYLLSSSAIHSISFSKSICFFGSLFLFLFNSPTSLERAMEHHEPQADQIELALNGPSWNGQTLYSDQGGVVKAPNIHFEAHVIQYTRQSGGKGYLIAKGGIYVNYFGSHFVGEELEFDFASGTGALRLARLQVGIWNIGGSRLLLLADGSYKIDHAWATTRTFPGIIWRGSAEQIIMSSDRKIELNALTLKIGNQRVLSFPALRTKAETLEHFPLSLSLRLGSKSTRKLGLCYTQVGPNYRSFFHLDHWRAGDWGTGLRLESRKKDLEWSTSHYFMRDQDKRKRVDFICNAKAQRCWPLYNSRLTFQISRSSNSHFADRIGNSRHFKSHRSTFLAYRHQWVNCALNARALVKVNPFETRKQELPCLQLFPKVQLWNRWHFNQGLESANLNLSYAKKSHQRGFSAWRTIWHGELYRHQRIADFLTATIMIGARGYSIKCKSQDMSCQWLIPRWEGRLQMPLWAKAGPFTTRCNLFAHHTLSPPPPISYRNCYVFDLNESIASNHNIEWGLCGVLNHKMRPLVDYNISFTDPIGSLVKPQPRRCLFDLTWYLTPRFECDLRSWFNREDRRFDRSMLRFRATLNERLAALLEYDRRSAKSWRGVGNHRDWIYKWHSENDLLNSDLSDRRQYLSSTIYWSVDPDLALKWQMRRGFDRMFLGKRQRRCYNEWGLGAVAIIPGQWKMQFCYERRMGVRGLRRYLIELVNTHQAPIVTKPDF